MTPADVATARWFADFYRMRGYNVLPSRVDAGRHYPCVPYADLWESPVDPALIERHPTSNLQVMAGVRWGLMVIDLDGPDAITWWQGLGRPVPPTWVVRSGGGGLHLWFSLPAGWSRPMPKGVLWKGDGPHSAAERLCDRSLVMAPPSVHVKTGRRYVFLDDRANGRVPHTKLGKPAVAPPWLLGMPILSAPAPAYTPHVRPATPRKVTVAGRYDARSVVEAIPDLIGLVRGWGVRFTGRARGDWHECHAIDREDREPSAAVNRVTGRYRDLGPSNLSLGLFDLACVLGRYHDWKDAVADLGSTYHARQFGRAV